MRITGFLALLAGLAAAALLAALALPIDAAAAPDPAPQAGPVPVLLPAAAPRTLDVPPDELSPTLGPAEQPPADFSAAQFIDSAGCVFVRTRDGWRARVARDGSPICGYPPTFSARRTGPDDVAPLFPEPAQPRAVLIERALTETIIPALQDGELLAAPLPETPIPAPHPPSVPGAQGFAAGRTAIAPPVAPPRAAGPASVAPLPPGAAGGPARVQAKAADDPLGFAAAVSSAGELRQQVAARAESSHLCDLIGAPAGASGPGPGSALGLCGQPAGPILPVARAAVAPGAATADGSGTQAAVAADDPTPIRAASAEPGPQRTPAAGPDMGDRAPGGGKARPAGTRTAKSPVRGRSGSGAPGPGTPSSVARGAPGPMMIPPGARYVQVGAFRNPQNAERAAQRLAGMGLPVVRSASSGGREPQSIMVGPLDGREAIVRTIDRVRRAGFRDAYARR